MIITAMSIAIIIKWRRKEATRSLVSKRNTPYLSARLFLPSLLLF